jgi:histone H3/H4
MSENLALASCARLIRKAGAERVGKEAAEELARILENIGVFISSEAIEYAGYAGRATVKKKDIEIAATKVLSNQSPEDVISLFLRPPSKVLRTGQ